MFHRWGRGPFVGRKHIFVIIPPAYEVWGRGVYTVFSLSVIPWVCHCEFISIQYLENELIELDQILHIQ